MHDDDSVSICVTRAGQRQSQNNWERQEQGAFVSSFYNSGYSSKVVVHDDQHGMCTEAAPQ